jgi:hypothetical protein
MASKPSQKTLSSGHRLEASGATQPVPNGDVAAFNALGGLTPTPMQASPDVGGVGQDSLDCLHIGLVMIADHLAGGHSRSVGSAGLPPR